MSIFDTFFRLSGRESSAINAVNNPIIPDARYATPTQDVAIGKVSPNRTSVESSRIDPQSFLGREDRNFYGKNLTDYRYAKTPDELLQILSKTDPDVSAGIWNFLRLASSGCRFVGLDKKMQPSDKVQKTVDQILFRLSGMTDFLNWDIRMSAEEQSVQLAKYVLLRGGTGLEMILGKDRRLMKLLTVDPMTVKFKQPQKGQFVPYQTDSNGVDIPLNIPTFFWALLDPDADSPYETPPFLPAISAVLFNIAVMQDLEKIVKRVAFPRLSIKVIEETLRKHMPTEVQADEAKAILWLNAQKSAIGDSLKNLAPEDAAVFFDSLEIGTIESKNNPTVDYKPLIQVIDQRVISGLKSLPTILGRQFGSSQTLSGVEALLYLKSVVCVQGVVAGILSRALTLALRLEGVQGFVQVKYKPVSLKPEHELAAFKKLTQDVTLELLSLGFYTDQQAAEILTGDPTLPAGFASLSGTGFYKAGSSNTASAINNSRNPTASEQAGSGRNTGGSGGQ